MKHLCAIAFSVAALSAFSQIWKDPNATPHDRAVSIVGEMTLDEKVALLENTSPAIPRLGIKQYDWWNEALHGVGRAGIATVFPQPIGMAASFDDKLVYDVFTAVSDEARAKNTAAQQQGPLKRYQGLTFWTPNINIFRDPRWGRGHETYGEDPYLTSVMGTSVVRGLQGDTYEGGLYHSPEAPKYYKLNACAKHYAVHSGPEWSRHSINIDYLQPRDLWETYLPAFKVLVQDADVREVMCAYNRFADEPCCGSNRLLSTILRDAWGYDGLVVSDCWAISDFHVKGRHETEPDAPHAAATAMRTGTDLECGETYGSLLEAVAQGLVDEATIDQSLIRLMEARFSLGEMDDPSLVSWASIPFSIVDCDEHRALAKRMALETMVLLKNDGTLPLKPGQKIGLLGPNANDSIMQWGNYNGFPSHTSTLYSALSQRLPKGQLVFIDGLDHTSSNNLQSLVGLTDASGKPGFDAKFWNDYTSLDQAAPREPDATIHYNSPLALTTAGATVWAPGVDLGGFCGVFSTTFKPETTEDIVFSLQTQGFLTISVNGNVVFRGGNMKSPNVYTLPVEAGKEYDISVTFAASEGECASLYFDFGRPMPLDIDAILAQLAPCDVVVYAGGLSPNLEGEEMPVKIPGFRGGDRETIELPAVQAQLLNALKGAGKTVVLVNYSGSAVALTEADAPAAAILQAWYPGQEGGEAVADVLLGDYNPGGRLPVTFYQSTADLPDIEDYNMANRTYRYFKGKPLYPFGHGLSYTTFAYGQPSVAKQGDDFVLTVPVANSGEIDGSEVVQVYISRPSDYDGPAMQLRGMQRVEIPAGETAEVSFTLSPKHFEWYDSEAQEMRPLSGEYLIYCGPSSSLENLKTISVTR